MRIHPTNSLKRLTFIGVMVASFALPLAAEPALAAAATGAASNGGPGAGAPGGSSPGPSGSGGGCAGRCGTLAPPPVARIPPRFVRFEPDRFGSSCFHMQPVYDRWGDFLGDRAIDRCY